MTETSNLNLRKPELGEPADIRDINHNMEILDTEAGDVRDKTDPTSEKDAPADEDWIVLADSTDQFKRVKLLWSKAVDFMKTVFYTKEESNAQNNTKADLAYVNEQFGQKLDKVTPTDWVIATGENGWTPSEWVGTKYRMTESGFVEINGIMLAPQVFDNTKSVFTLPLGFRPSEQTWINATSGSGKALIFYLLPTGGVYWWGTQTPSSNDSVVFTRTFKAV